MSSERNFPHELPHKFHDHLRQAPAFPPDIKTY